MAVQVDLTVDRSSPVPLYHQLAEQLRAAIASGRLKPGDQSRNVATSGCGPPNPSSR
ncbi:hypothetical protein [Nonomuraea sp. B19D2]|uniref:hypothetical protein n=1 Tax=Nonomuraea sp. B19D2 TaxID=3159561 RepID=UPI0032DB541D